MTRFAETERHELQPLPERAFEPVEWDRDEGSHGGGVRSGPGGQRPDGREPLAGLERSAGALGTDLGGDLPRDRHARGCFYANPHCFAPSVITII